MPYLYKKKVKKKKPINYFRGEKCCIENCREKVKGIHKRKFYCQKHYKLKLWAEKSKPRKWKIRLI